ncbi:MAG TPA: hypothetical protein PK639_01670 [Candidatus Woesebacteria bacterium]|nr:hypothetical protein [Candidatus Woesebacteria bacterium]
MRIKDAIEEYPVYRAVLGKAQSQFGVQEINGEVVALMDDEVERGRIFFELVNNLGKPSTHCSSIFARGHKVGKPKRS